MAWGNDLLVADSYNDCIKLVNPELHTSSVWLRRLHEPEGVACSTTHVYIADTNAHRIAVIDIATKAVTDLMLE